MEQNNQGLVQIIFLSKWVLAVGEPAVHLPGCILIQVDKPVMVGSLERFLAFSAGTLLQFFSTTRQMCCLKRLAVNICDAVFPHGDA